MLHADQSQLFSARIFSWKWAVVVGLGTTCATFIVASERAAILPIVAPAVSASAAPANPHPSIIGDSLVMRTDIDTAALIEPAVQTAPVQTASVLPPVKPRSRVTIKGSDERSREPAPAKVASFQSCLPSCETRDPQVATLEPVPSAAPARPVAFDMSAPPPPPRGAVDVALDSSRVLIDHVADASDAVIGGTRRALGMAADLVW